MLTSLQRRASACGLSATLDAPSSLTLSRMPLRPAVPPLHPPRPPWLRVTVLPLLPRAAAASVHDSGGGGDEGLFEVVSSDRTPWAIDQLPGSGGVDVAECRGWQCSRGPLADGPLAEGSEGSAGRTAEGRTPEGRTPEGQMSVQLQCAVWGTKGVEGRGAGTRVTGAGGSGGGGFWAAAWEG